jgi:hypothetical protein
MRNLTLEEIPMKNEKTEVSLVTPTADSMAAVLAAVQMAGIVEPPIIPQGMVGGCTACGHTVASHFKAGTNGTVEFVGCLKGEADTVYILIPAARAGKGKNGVPVVVPQSDIANDAGLQEPARQARIGRRAVYFSTLHHKAKPENVKHEDAPLSETRLKVLKAVHDAGKHTGVRSKDILKKTKLPHGSVQQTLHWLRAHGFVDARAVEPKPAVSTAA